jgi:DNA-binding response OmpR family regulator
MASRRECWIGECRQVEVDCSRGKVALSETMQRLLVVEDDPRIAQLLTRFLTGENFAVDVVSDGREAVDCILEDPPALVVLDMRLPRLDGIDVCQAVRPRFKAPILMLTANDDDLTEVAALNAGIDDYLSKPVRPHVLLARIRALLRRTEMVPAAPMPHSDVTIQDLVLNADARTVTRSGQALQVSDSEFQLLSILSESAGAVVTRDSLLDLLRGIEAQGPDRSVDMRISKLRKRLGDTKSPYRYIRTVRNMGYLLLTDSPA